MSRIRLDVRRMLAQSASRPFVAYVKMSIHQDLHCFNITSAARILRRISMRGRNEAWLVCIASIESYRAMIESRIDDRLSIPYTSKCIPRLCLPLYTSAISLNRRRVDRIAAAAGVLKPIPVSISRPSPSTSPFLD